MTNILFHFRSLLFSLALLAISSLFATHVIKASDKVGITLFVVFALITVYISHYLGKRFLYSLIPLSIFTTGLMMLYFIDPSRERIIFAFFISFVYYIALLAITRMAKNIYDDTARTLFAISLVVMLFFFYSSAYGIYINFAVTLWQFLFVIFLTVFFATFVSLFTYSKKKRYVFLYSLVIAYAMTQIAWMINFWPFGYLTDAIVNVIFYYILWDLAFMYFADRLSKKRALTNIITGGILILLVLFTSQWVLI